MQRWLAWPTFFHSSASSSSWELWVYSRRRELIHAWPVIVRRRDGSAVREGSAESQIQDTTYYSFPSLVFLFPLTLRLVLWCVPLSYV